MTAEYGEKGLVCFAIHPGSVPTDLGLTLPEELHSILTDTMELASDTILWLGKEHRPWLSGRYITVSWDMEELEAKKDEIVEKDVLKFRLFL